MGLVLRVWGLGVQGFRALNTPSPEPVKRPEQLTASESSSGSHHLVVSCGLGFGDFRVLGLGLKEFREEVGIYRVVECCTGMYGAWSLGVRGAREWDLRLEDGIAAAPAK